MPAHRNDAKADAMYALYQQGFSLADVGTAFATTRQGVFKMFAKRHYPRRTRKPLPFMVWSGHKYTLRPNGYYARTAEGRRYLHRDVWMAVHGPIPAGHDIHHLDGDRTNNAPVNLECCAASEHGKRHGFASNQAVFVSHRRPVRNPAQ